MEQLIVEFVRGFDIQTLIGTAAIVWYMTKGIRIRLDKIELEMRDIQKTLIDLDKRLTVVEAILHTRECCMLKDGEKARKAE